jgi:hypothetical protein
VDLRITRHVLEVYYRGQCVARHLHPPGSRRFITAPVLPHVILLPVASSAMLPAACLSMSQGWDSSLWARSSVDAVNVGQTPGAKHREEFRGSEGKLFTEGGGLFCRTNSDILCEFFHFENQPLNRFATPRLHATP